MVKAMDCEIVVSKIELKSRHFVQFQINTFSNGMNRLFLKAIG